MYERRQLSTIPTSNFQADATPDRQNFRSLGSGLHEAPEFEWSDHQRSLTNPCKVAGRSQAGVRTQAQARTHGYAYTCEDVVPRGYGTHEQGDCAESLLTRENFEFVT